MAVADIALANSGNAIKNGTIVLSATETGYYYVIDTYVVEIPSLADIQFKYDIRFDDYYYYFGGGSGGGAATGNLIGY